MGKIIKILFLVLLYCNQSSLHAQLTIRDFVLYGKESVLLSSSSSIIDGGKVGSDVLIRSSGTANLNSGLHSKGIIQLANSNSIKGNISAANSGNHIGTGVQIGSNTNIQGTIDANGNITITSGTVIGPIVSSGSYNGPQPTSGIVVQNGSPNLPNLPDLPQLLVPVNYNTINPAVVNTSNISPGSYVSMGLTGSKTVTFNGTGDYVFGSILNSGNFNKFIFDFKGNTTGIFRIFVTGNVDLNRILIEQVNLPLPATPTTLDIAARVLMQVNGTGGTNGYAWSITNGASGNNQSNFYGTVIAPNGSINVGSGSSLSKIVGGLWSGKTINIQSGVSITYSALICSQAIADAGENKTFTCPETQTSIGTNNSNGTSYKWTTIIDGVETIVGDQKIISVNKPGTYTLHVSNNCGVTVSDEVVVSYISCVEPINETPVGSVDNLIGHVLTFLDDTTKLEEAKKHIVIVGSSYDSVLIEAVAIVGFEKAAYDTLYKYGLRDTITNGLNPLLITGVFPIANLLTLTQAGPKTVLNEVRPVYLPFGNAGTVTSKGDISVGADLVRKGFNVLGDSVKIGVISDSYNTLNRAHLDVSNGDLPGVGNEDGNLKPVHIIQEFPWGARSDEGRAMLQIIHDLAPKAHLAFRTGFISAGDFANGIIQLKDAGCKIIVDDVTYITEPFFKDGIVSKAVSIVKEFGVSYFTSAGNFGNKSYSSNFNPVTVPGSGVIAHNFGGGDIHQRLKLKSGSYTIVLQWQDEFYSLGGNTGAKNDFDIYLIDPSGKIGFNRNNLGADPVEVLSFSINLADTSQVIDADLMIVKAGSASGAISNPLIKYIIFRGSATIAEYYSELPLVNKSTIVGHANSEHAISVGAVLWSNTPSFGVVPTIASFSSTGGTPIFNGTGSVVRAKPELTGPNGVNTSKEVTMGPDNEGDGTGDGFPNFYGTSASAPHAAAVAALIIDARKRYYEETLTPDALKYILFNTAIPMQPDGVIGGVNFKAGYGLVQANLAIRSFANPTPFINQLVYSSEITPGTTPFTLTVKGEHLSPDAVIYFRGEPIQTIVNSSLTELTGEIPIFTGNPPINVLNPSFEGATNDGGLSNSLFFFTAVKDTVRIIVDNKVKKYGEALPELTATILLNNDTLEVYNQKNGTNVTLADLGVENLNFRYSNSTVNALTDIGSYQIRVSRPFDTTNEDDIALLEKYHYDSTFGNLQIEKLPVTVKPRDTTITYGYAINNLQFDYIIPDNININDPSIINSIKTTHENQLANDVIAFANGVPVAYVNGVPVAIINIVINGVPVAVINGVPVSVVNGVPVSIVNGVPVAFVNGVPVSVVNSESLKMVNGNPLVVADVLANGVPVAIVNGVPVAFINAVPVSYVNGVPVSYVNGVPVSYVNGVVNGVPVAFINGVPIAYVNGVPVAVVNTIINGVPVAVVNGVPVAFVNGVPVAYVNGVPVSIVNGESILLVNEMPVVIANVLVNGVPVAVVNGVPVAFINAVPVSYVNGVPVSYVNAVPVSYVNGIVNGVPVAYINGVPVAFVNAVPVSFVNSIEEQELTNKGFMATSNAISNAREISNTINGSTQVTKVVDLTQQSIFDFNINPDTTATTLKNSVDGVNGRGLLNFAQILNGVPVAVINGVPVSVVNAVPVAIINGVPVSVVNTIINGVPVAVVNGVPVAFVNGVPVAYVNGETVPIVNGESIQLINGSPLVIANVLANGVPVAYVNGVPVAYVNGVPVAYVNDVQEPVVNAVPVSIVNGVPVSYVNGVPVSFVNGVPVAYVNGVPVSIVNSETETPVIIDEDDLTVGFTDIKSVNLITGITAGIQTIVAGALLSDNLDVQYLTGTLTIIPAPLTIKAKNVDKIYGEEIVLDTTDFEITSGSLINGDVISYVKLSSEGVSSNAAVGTYTIIPYDATGNETTDLSNYLITYVNGILSVNCGGPESQCTVPTSFTNDVVLSGNKKWSDILPKVSPDNITGTIRIRGSGTLTVSNKNLLLKSNKAVLVIEGITLIIDNGNFGLDNSYSRVIIKDATVRVSGNLNQNTFTQLCISNSELEVGDELSNGTFSFSGSATSGDFLNNGGYRYLNNVCLNVTKNLLLSSAGNGTVSGGGLDVFVNVKGEIGDQGSNNACTGSDSNDNGNWQSNNRQEIYCSEFDVIDNIINSSTSTMVVKGADFRTLKGNFENSGTITGNGLNLAINSQILNSGTWSAGVDMWYAAGTSGTLSIGTRAASLQAVLDAKFDCGCNSSNSEFITSASRSADVSESNTFPGIYVYPNPATSFINISFVPEATGTSTIGLYSIDGRKITEIFNGVTEAGKTYNKQMLISDVPYGMYLIRLQEKGNVRVKKIVINK